MRRLSLLLMSPQCLDKRNPIEPPISLSDVADVNLYTANKIKWILRTLIMNEKLISRSVRQDDKMKLEISLSRHCGEVNEKFISRSVRQADKTKLEISLSRHCGEVNYE